MIAICITAASGLATSVAGVVFLLCLTGLLLLFNVVLVYNDPFWFPGCRLNTSRQYQFSRKQTNKPDHGGISMTDYSKNHGVADGVSTHRSTVRSTAFQGNQPTFQQFNPQFQNMSLSQYCQPQLQQNHNQPV